MENDIPNKKVKKNRKEKDFHKSSHPLFFFFFFSFFFFFFFPLSLSFIFHPSPFKKRRRRQRGIMLLIKRIITSLEEVPSEIEQPRIHEYLNAVVAKVTEV